MQAAAKKCKTKFVQGEVIGFEFQDMSDLASTQSSYNAFYSPCRAVVCFIDSLTNLYIFLLI